MSTLLMLLATADAAPLHRCRGTATGPADISFRVTGYGATAADAKRSLRQSQRFLADQHLLSTAARAWIARDDSATEALAAAIAAPADASFATPGWRVDSPACDTTPIATEGAHAATWGDEGERVERGSAAGAVEASRRRSCLALYQMRFLQGIEATHAAEPAERNAVAKATVDAVSDLVDCWTKDAYTLDAAEAPAVVAQPTRCVAIGPAGGALAVGHGADPELAAEDAQRQALVVRSRRTLASLGRAQAVTAPADGAEAAYAATLKALRGLAGLSGPTDAVDRARLACNQVAPGPFAWSPNSFDRERCNAMTWTERPRDPVPVDAIGAFQDTSCALQVDPTLQIIRFSMRSSRGGDRDQLVASALRVTGACESACYAEGVWGKIGRPVALPGAPDRSSKQRVVAQIRSLDADKPLAALPLLPSVQEPAALQRLFSGQLITALKAEGAALAGNDGRWREVNGHWIPLPPE